LPGGEAVRAVVLVLGANDVQGLLNFLRSLGAARMGAMAAVTVALVGFFAFLMSVVRDFETEGGVI
jgi:hypothetical protein